jgi:hypothetical protein
MDVASTSEDTVGRSSAAVVGALPPKALEVTADLFVVADAKRQTEVALLDQLKTRAVNEYLAKGFHILGFEVQEVRLENGSNEPDQSLKAFFNGTYGKIKATDGIRAKCKLLLVPVDDKGTDAVVAAAPAPSVAPATPRETAAESKASDATEDTLSVGEMSDESPTPPAPTTAPAVNSVQVTVASVAPVPGAAAKAFISPKPYDPAGFLLGPDILEEVLPPSPVACSVLQLFETCYTDESDLKLRYHERRNDEDIIVGKWTDDPQFGKVRFNTFVVRLSEPIGPKSTRSEEHQRYNLQEDKLVVETHSSMLDTPFSDRFRVESIFEARSTGPSSCDVTIRCKPVFTGKTILEGTITKKTMSGMRDSMQLWFDLLRERVAKAAGAGDVASVVVTTQVPTSPTSAAAPAKVEVRAGPAPRPQDAGRMVMEIDLSLVAELVGEMVKYRVLLIPLLLNLLFTFIILVRH